MRIAIVHHWFISEGGGEHVAEAIAALFPDADIFTLIADPKLLPLSLQKRHVHESFLGRIPLSRRFHRHLLPLYPLAVENLDLRGYDLVISSDAGPVKGVLTVPEAVHLCYCHSPMRYLWNQYHEYYEDMPSLGRHIFALAAHYARSWDFAAAQRVTGFLANSVNVAGRIRQYYARESEILYPPVETSYGTISREVEDHYLTAGRLVPYKRVDLMIEACNHLHRKLRVIGSGPEEDRLRAMAGPTIEFLGHVDTATLWKEYARCRALLVAANEDFGMVSVEAQACGRPVIAYGRGGSLESVCSGAGSCQLGLSTGLFFYEQSVRAVMHAINKFESIEERFDPSFIRDWTRQFDVTCFAHRFRRTVEKILEHGAQYTHSGRTYETPAGY